ncbi:MAG TPA: chloride channel protein, partial [Pirellulales bacterium]|nr:chloride channel protein [Pirellulales bacterium]
KRRGTQPDVMADPLPPRHTPLPPSLLSLAAVLVGTIAGLGAVVFRGLIALVHNLLFLGQLSVHYFFEAKVPGGYYLRHGAGMLLVGISIYVLMATTGHYYIDGVGYSTVQEVLSGPLTNPWFLLLLAALKLLATSLTLGSGASGGIFSPALYLGATLGGACGWLLKDVFPQWGVLPTAFAVAGMAGVVGGATGAAMAAIVMIFEMTLDYNVIVPMTITVALSYEVRRALSPESIYTMKLARRGHHMPDALQTNFHQFMRASDLMDTGVVLLPPTQTLGELVILIREQPAIPCYLVADGEQVAGYVLRDAAWELFENRSATTPLADVVRRDYFGVGEGATLFDVVAEMHTRGATVAFIAQDDGGSFPAKAVRGLITRQQIAASLVEAVELFGE